MTNSITPLLNGMWEKVDSEDEVHSTISGKWFEDNSVYKIIVPRQLADCIILMQNYFVKRYETMNKLKETIKSFDHELF